MFKRLLTGDQLALLRTLGHLEKANNRTYFRGHVGGKLAARPSIDIGLAIHKAWTTRRTQVPVVHDGAQHVLHYESPNGDEFVRKWTALLTSGTVVRQRTARAPMAQSVGALLGLGLGEEETAHFLRAIYERHAVDAVETLDRLGFLVHADADQPRPAREPFPASAKDELRALIERVRTVPKRQFRPTAPGENVIETVKRVHRDLGR
jgi:hypothetical protein